MNPFILVRPVITEKSYRLAQTGVFAFFVDLHATKGQVRDAVEKTFNVKVVDIRTAVVAGKTKRTGSKRTPHKLPDRKKAYVKLADGQKIELFDVMNREEEKTA